MLYQRILITGSNGLLGQELVSRLSQDSRFDVLATSNAPDPKFRGASCGYIGLDITNAAEVRSIFADFAPSVVVNCAAMTDVDLCEQNRKRCWDVNAQSVTRLARECRASGARIVQISTDFVFDGKQGPYREADRPNPLNYYGKAKLGGENAAREAGMDRWAIVRTNVVFGTGEQLRRSNFALWVLRQISEGRAVHVFTDQIRTPTYVRDLADGIIRIVRYGKTGMYHISGRDLISMHAFAQAIARAFRLNEDLVKPISSGAFQQRAMRPRKTGLIILKAETELGYRPDSTEAALARLRQRLDYAPG